MFSTGTKKPALACAKSGLEIPSLASIYKALCKLSSNQRLISLYAYGLFSQQLIRLQEQVDPQIFLAALALSLQHLIQDRIIVSPIPFSALCLLL